MYVWALEDWWYINIKITERLVRKESIERDAVILNPLTFCHSESLDILSFCDSVPCPVNIAREMEALPGLGLGGSEASM